MIRAGESLTILGAGLTGSLLAIMLAQRGMRITLLERHPDPRVHPPEAGRSINLAMAARGMHALRQVGLSDQIGPLMCPMPGRLLHAPDGALQFQRYGSRETDINWSVSRAGLNAMLLDAAEAHGVDMRFRQVCEGYLPQQQLLEMHDQSGDGQRYRLGVRRIIAADGAGSPIRRALHGAGLVDATEQLLGHRYQEIAIPPAANGDYAMRADALHVWPRGEYMLIALPNPGHDFTATLFMPEHDADGGPSFSWWKDSRRAVNFLADTFPDLPPLVDDLAAQIEAHPLGILGTVRCEPWHFRDQCLLIGDAAHAIVPFHGQGMNAAFEDCVKLIGIIEGAGDWQQAFKQFSETRIGDANAIARMALENYTEMRDTVRDPGFHLRKALALHLEQACPEHFISRYSMVMFHADIDYAVAYQRGEQQAHLLAECTAGIDQFEQLDLAACEARARRELPTLKKNPPAL